MPLLGKKPDPKEQVSVYNLLLWYWCKKDWLVAISVATDNMVLYTSSTRDWLELRYVRQPTLIGVCSKACTVIQQSIHRSFCQFWKESTEEWASYRDGNHHVCPLSLVFRSENGDPSYGRNRESLTDRYEVNLLQFKVCTLPALWKHCDRDQNEIKWSTNDLVSRDQFLRDQLPPDQHTCCRRYICDRDQNEIKWSTNSVSQDQFS